VQKFGGNRLERLVDDLHGIEYIGSLLIIANALILAKQLKSVIMTGNYYMVE
jgi:hypothetical protein